MIIATIAQSLIWIALAAVIGYVMAKNRRHADAALPANAPRGNHTTRVTEATILGVLGAVLLLMISITEHTNGLIHRLFEEPAPVTKIAVSLLAMAVIGYLAGVVLAARGRAMTATAVLALTFIGYGTLLNASGLVSNARRSSAPAAEPTLQINVSSTNVDGVDMWINGVHVGKTPIKITLAELLDTIPEWETVPDSQLSDEALAVDASRYQNFVRHHFDKRWGTISLPNADWLKGDIATRVRNLANNRVFVRTAFNGEDGLRTGSSGSSGDGTRYGISVGFQFPKRLAAIEELINQARLADDRVDIGWIEAFSTYGNDGLIALARAVVAEPSLSSVRQTLVDDRFKTRELTPRSAWELIEQVSEAADKQDYYSTFDLSADAVRAAVPFLTWQDLAAVGRQIIASTSDVAYSRFQVGDVNHWGVFRGDARLTNTGASSSSQTVWGNRNRLTPGQAVYVHTIIEFLNMHPADSPAGKSLRNELAVAIIRAGANTTSTFVLETLAAVGGDTAGKYLSGHARRHRWNSAGPTYLDRMPSFGDDINRWWYFAAAVPGDVGDGFREQNRSDIFNMSDAISRSLFSASEVENDLRFLFVDGSSNPSSLALEYWPRYCAAIESQRQYASLELKVAYLVAADARRANDGFANEHVVPIESYANLWTLETDESNAGEALRWLARLPKERRAAVLDAILDSVINNNGLTADWAEDVRKGRGYFWQKFRELRYEQIDDAISADDFRSRIEGDSYESGRMRAWIVENGATRPVLMSRLASDESQLAQMLVVEAAAVRPTRSVQALVKSLVASEHAEVAKAATDLLAKWSKQDGS